MKFRKTKWLCSSVVLDGHAARNAQGNASEIIQSMSDAAYDAMLALDGDAARCVTKSERALAAKDPDAVAYLERKAKKGGAL